MNETEQGLTPAQIAARLQAIDDRLDRGAEKMDRLGDELEHNSRTTQEVRELLDMAKSGLRVLGWLGVAGKWLGSLATAGLAIYGLVYALTHGGQLPPKP